MAYHPDDLTKIRFAKKLSEKGKVLFTGIGEFTNQQRHLFNTGSLRWDAKIGKIDNKPLNQQTKGIVIKIKRIKVTPLGTDKEEILILILILIMN